MVLGLGPRLLPPKHSLFWYCVWVYLIPLTIIGNFVDWPNYLKQTCTRLRKVLIPRICDYISPNSSLVHKVQVSDRNYSVNISSICILKGFLCRHSSFQCTNCLAGVIGFSWRLNKTFNLVFSLRAGYFRLGRCLTRPCSRYPAFILLIVACEICGK